MIKISEPAIGPEEVEAVKSVLLSKNIAAGVKVAEFCSVKHALAVSSGTAGLHAALHAVGIKAGDEVITTPFTFAATANSILMCHAKPVFVDIDKETFNISPERITEKITRRTKAVLTVDLYGQLCDYPKIKKIAEEHNLIVIEDACQAVNAELEGKKAGSFGDISVFSFYATKNIVTGEGGMVVTNEDRYAELVKRFRQHGQIQRYEYETLGYNYRMTDIAAAIGLEQLKKIDSLTKKRIENAEYLTQNLQGINWIKLPKVKYGKHVFHQYTIKVPEKIRDALFLYLKENGVETGIYYPKPLHLFPHFLSNAKPALPVTEGISKLVMSLPVHPLLNKGDLDKIIKLINLFDKKKANEQ